MAESDGEKRRLNEAEFFTSADNHTSLLSTLLSEGTTGRTKKGPDPRCFVPKFRRAEPSIILKMYANLAPLCLLNLRSSANL